MIFMIKRIGKGRGRFRAENSEFPEKKGTKAGDFDGTPAEGSNGICGTELTEFFWRKAGPNFQIFQIAKLEEKGKRQSNEVARTIAFPNSCGGQ